MYERPLVLKTMKSAWSESALTSEAIPMIPKAMKTFLHEILPESVWDTKLQRVGPAAYLEFGPLDVDRLQRLGIKVDRLGPRVVVCMWEEESALEIGGYLIVDNLAMGQPSMGGIRMRSDINPTVIHNLARGMTLKNAAADLPFGGGKAGIVSRNDLPAEEHSKVIRGFGRLLNRYSEVYIPGPDVGTNDADMKLIAIENGLDHVVSKPAEMGGNRIDELGGAAHGVVVAVKALLDLMPKLKALPQFRDVDVPELRAMDVLIQGFGAVGANVARIFHEYDDQPAPLVTGISDEKGYLFSKQGLPWKELFELWKEHGTVTERLYHERLHKGCAGPEEIIYSNDCNKLLQEPAFCFIPAAPVANYLDIDSKSNPSMTVDRMGSWQMIVEGANTYSPDPLRKAERRRMERAVYRDKGVLIATDYLVNSGGVINAAHEWIIPTPQHLHIPEKNIGDIEAVEAWLSENQEELARLAEKRRQEAAAKLEEVIRRNMQELVHGLCADHDSLPCDTAEQISVGRIAGKEKSRTVRDVMAEIPTISVDRSIPEAAQLLIDTNSPIVAVVSQKSKLIGIVTNWDVTNALATGLHQDSPLTEIMTANVISIAPDCPIIDCIRRLEHYEISAMPVEEEGRVIGRISGDLLARRTLFRLLQTGE